jgi:hypothetical protein
MARNCQARPLDECGLKDGEFYMQEEQIRSGCPLDRDEEIELVIPRDLTSRLAEARRRVVHMAPSQRLHQDQVENRWIDATDDIRRCYPYFVIFYVLGSRNIVVI